MKFILLDYDQKKASKMLCDKHVRTLPLETCQLLCNAHHYYNPNREKEIPYSAHNMNHIVTKWLLESLDNYLWLLDMLYYQMREYTIRFGKQHKTQRELEWLRDNKPKYNNKIGLTDFPKNLPQKYISGDIVSSYRKYYANEKKGMLKYTKRKKPTWI